MQSKNLFGSPHCARDDDSIRHHCEDPLRMLGRHGNPGHLNSTCNMHKFFIFLSLITLAGCTGFDPLYKPKTEQQRSLPFALQVSGDNENAYSTYKFKQELTSALSSLSSPPGEKLKIKVLLSEAFGDIGYGSKASILRSQGRMIATVEIYRNGITPIYKNSVDTVSSYTINNSEEFSNLNAKNATRERIMINLANEVAREISLVIRKLESSQSDLEAKKKL